MGWGNNWRTQTSGTPLSSSGSKQSVTPAIPRCSVVHKWCTLSQTQKQSPMGALATSTAAGLPVCCFCPEMQKHKMEVVLLEIILLFSAVWSPRQLRVCLKHKANKPWCESCNRATGCQCVFLRLYKSNSWAALYNKYVYTHLFFLVNRRPIIISYWNEADTDCERKPNQTNSFPQ